MMQKVNHFFANMKFRVLYSRIQDHFGALESFLKHIHEFIGKTEEKIGPELKLYSEDWFEFYHAGMYGETFRSSFVVTVCSVTEVYLKDYINVWKDLGNNTLDDVKNTNGIIDYLKEVDKDSFNIHIDFGNIAVHDFRCILAVRNSLVHSSGTLEFVEKYRSKILQLTKRYKSLRLEKDVLFTDEKFCSDSIDICKRFLFHIFKHALKKFPNYREDMPPEYDLDFEI